MEKLKSKIIKYILLLVTVVIAGKAGIAKVEAASIFEYENFYQSFEHYDSDTMDIADGWSNGSMFNCTWRNSNVSFANGSMNLSINNDIVGSPTKYSGGEVRTQQYFHYGMYEIKMKPIKNDGVVSSFFTYTGPTDGTPWDEIDIEFLGRDTTKVQFNYFTNGVGEHEYVYDLGFDVSNTSHTYGFDWQKDHITWYVDGNPVYTATKNIPTHAGKIMLNVWPGTGVDDWLKHFDGKTPITAQYDYMSFKKSASTPQQTSGYVNWETDAAWDQYLLEKDNSATTVYRHNRNDQWAYLTGNLSNQVTNPKKYRMKLNFIEGNILALTVKVKDIYGNEQEIGQVSYSDYEKGIREFELPVDYVGKISQIILMINSNPNQLDLRYDANCKVEILEASLSN